MEGAVARLPQLVEICKRHGAMLVVDDSHGVGVLGKGGRGTVEHFGLMGQVDVITGTLGKALGGAAGGYVAGSQRLIDLLIQRSRPSLFSNALPATVAYSANKAIEIVERALERHVRYRADQVEKWAAKVAAGVLRYTTKPRGDGSLDGDVTCSRSPRVVLGCGF